MKELQNVLVVKVGTNTLIEKQASGSERLDRASFRRIGRQVLDLQRQNTQTVLVSSGAITAGRVATGCEPRPTGRNWHGIHLRNTTKPSVIGGSTMNKTTQNKPKQVAVIGLGTMGSAIQQLLQRDFDVIGIDRTSGKLEDAAAADVVILAVKPQSFAELARELRPHIHEQLVLSIMAGVTTKTLTNTLSTRRIVRTMPNLALATGQSMTAWYAVKDTQTTESATVQAILDKWGKSIQLKDEAQFDAFTALAGSGPAYFFQLAYLLEEIALRQGFTAEQARQMSLQTLRGAASVLATDESAGVWVQRVASKGGTTEAALKVLDERELEAIVEEAVGAARGRSATVGVESGS